MRLELQEIKPDLNNAENIRLLIEAFYSKLLKDKDLAPIFIDVAQVDLSGHKLIICQYWEKLLLGETAYRRHTMNIHRALDEKRKLHSLDFEKWLLYFTSTVDALFSGKYAIKAKQTARTIAENMNSAVGNEALKQI